MRRYDALPLRQRILAEAAVHLLSPRRDEPLVVQLPERWNPGRGWRKARFFAGLDVPWLLGASAATVARTSAATSTIEADSEDLVYPTDAPEVPAVNFVSALNLIDRAHTLEVMLDDEDPIVQRLTSYALLGTTAQLRDLRTSRSDAPMTCSPP